MCWIRCNCAESGSLDDRDEYGNWTFFNSALPWSKAIQTSPIIPEYRPTPDTWLNDGSGALE